MSTQPCRCCKDGKPGAGGGGTGYGFNRLEGEAREWAASNRFSRSEYCVPVKGGSRFGGQDWQKNKCGDGRMGFSTRRKGQEEVRMEQGLDGQLKKKRSTLVNKKSARAVVSRRARRIDGSKTGLVSSETIKKAQRDPVVVAQQKKERKKTKRKEYHKSIGRSKLRRATKRARKHEQVMRMAA